MLSARLLFLAALVGSAVTFPANRSTTEANHNWKFQFPSPSTTAYIESTTNLPTDLNQVTVSFWVKELSSVSSISRGVAYFSTPSTQLELYTHIVTTGTYSRYTNPRTTYTYTPHLTLAVNGATTTCSSYVCVNRGTLRHIVVTWNGTAGANGVGSFWVSGTKVHTFSSLSSSGVIEKGLKLKLGQRYNRDGSYTFGGDIMYLNVYPTYVTTAEEVAKLAKVATSDSEAVVPWGSFIGGARGHVVLYPEYELYTKAYTDIACHPHNMTVTLVRSAFPHLIPSRMSLRDSSCRVDYTDEQVTVSTGLTECGTAVEYTGSTAKYTNYIVADILNPPTDVEGNVTTHSGVDRERIDLYESSLSFQCTYTYNALVPHRTIAAYAVRSTNLKLRGTTSRDFSFELKLYHDSSYDTMYRDEEYPLHAASKERIYVAALLANGGNIGPTIRVEKCVMTPDADPAYSTNHVILAEGCPTDDTVQLHKSDNLQEQRFSFEVFRFSANPSAVVYMHCYIDVCQSSEEDSKCTQGWSTCETE